MLVNLNTNYSKNYFIKNQKDSQNISFEARYPRTKRVTISDKKALYGSLVAAITALVTTFNNIYNNSKNIENPFKKRRELAEMTSLKESDIENFIKSNYLETVTGTYNYNIENEQNKAMIKNMLCITVSRGELAKALGVNIHSIDHHISKGSLILDEDGLIDLSDPQNKRFCENFKKGTRKVVPISREELNESFDSNALSYFVKNGLLVADEQGNINLSDENNQKFLQRLKNKEISIDDYVVSIAKFATLTGRTPLTIKRSINKKEIVLNKEGRIDIFATKNAAYLKIYNAENKNNPNLKTLNEVAEILGYKSALSVKYYIDFNEIVREPNGLIDISKEPNKTFIEKRLSGMGQKPVSRSGATARTKKKEQPAEPNYNIITRERLAMIKNITVSSISWHIEQGHIVLTDGKIDMRHPINDYFIKNFKAGKPFLPVQKAINPMKYIFVSKNSQKPKSSKIKTSFANQTTKKGLVAIVGITATPITKNTEAGRLVLNEKGLYDLSDEKNISFMKYYIKNYENKIKTMSNEELLDAREKLKDYINQYISRNQYFVAKSLSESQEELNGYISYLTKAIINTEDLTPMQVAEVNSIVEEIMISKISKENFDDYVNNLKLFTLEGKCELYANKLLLQRLAEIKVSKNQ